MKFKYDTSTDEGKAQVMLEFARTKMTVLQTKRGSTAWIAAYNPSWDWLCCDYNYPLEPKLVPWTLSTVPKVGVLLESNGVIQVPQAFTRIGIKLHSNNHVYSYNNLSEYTHSLDGGVTWQPCGTTEQ